MIQDFADWLVYGLFGLSADTSIGVAVNFFFYDTIKILILLFFISVLMGIINAYFPIERLRKYLVTHKMYGLQYLLASLFGAITPFCSCSSIPLFIGFVKGGIPLGVTFAFLITSPLVNESCRRHVSRLIRPEGDAHLRHQWHLVGHDRRLRPWPHAPHALSERLGKADTGPFFRTGGGMGKGSYPFHRSAPNHPARCLANSQRRACLHTDRYRHRRFHARFRA